MTDNQTPLTPTPQQTDHQPHIIVIGASAGGVEALKELATGFPADLPAAVLMVIHITANATSYLPSILTRAGSLPASHAVNGQAIERGHIYVAPPNFHLSLAGDTIQLQTGPRINGVRPAIDVLFQSAALTARGPVIGVILSGTQDDGVAGLATIKMQNGISIVQDPETALYPALPINAINNVQPDYILPLKQIAKRLVELVANHPSEQGPTAERQETAGEIKNVEEDIRLYEKHGTVENNRTVLTCPECGGILWEYKQGDILQYRCHVGHVFSQDIVYAKQDEALENALWKAVRMLRERAILSKRLAVQARTGGREQSETFFLNQARHSEDSANLIYNLLLNDEKK